MREISLFEPTRLGPLSLRNRLVMSPLTRNRATAANVPTALMAEYYGQRAGAELLAPSAVAAAGQMYTDAQGLQDHPVPRAMTDAEVRHAATSLCTTP